MFVRPRPDRIRDNELAWGAEIVGTSRRALFLVGPMLSYTARQDMYSPTRVFESLLALALESSDPIVLFVASEGGSIDVGMTLYDTIRASPAPVTTIGMSCASMASLIFAAGRRRLLLPHARLMLHLPRINAQEFSVDSRDLELCQQEMNKIRDAMVDCYIECGVKRSRDELLADIDRMLWLSAEESVRYGLADGIVTSDDLYYLGRHKRFLEPGDEGYEPPSPELLTELAALQSEVTDVV